MTFNIDIHWQGPSDADANSQYEIYYDLNNIGQFSLLATVNATSPYVSPSTTLQSGVSESDTSITLSDASSFADGDIVKIESETVKLGGWNGSAFTSCVRAYDYGVPVAHNAGATVVKLHESYSLSNVAVDSAQKAVTFRIYHVNGSNKSLASESRAITIPEPLDGFAIVFGLILSPDGTPQSGVPVVVEFGDTDNFINSSGGLIYSQSKVLETGEDGVWSLALAQGQHVNAVTGAADPITFTVAKGTAQQFIHKVDSIPNQTYVNFLAIPPSSSP